MTATHKHPACLRTSDQSCQSIALTSSLPLLVSHLPSQDQTRPQQQQVASKRRGLTQEQEKELLRRAAALRIHVSPYLLHKRNPAHEADA